MSKLLFKQEMFNHIFANKGTGDIEVGTIDDDVIEIIGVLKTSTGRTTFKLVITHNDVDAYVDYSLLPDIEKLRGLFSGAQLLGTQLFLTYLVPDEGYLLKIKGIKKTYKL